MARSKHYSKKLRLGKKGRQTNWAPIWAVLRKYGKGRRVHPSRITTVKRSWRRSSTKA